MVVTETAHIANSEDILATIQNEAEFISYLRGAGKVRASRDISYAPQVSTRDDARDDRASATEHLASASKALDKILDAGGDYKEALATKKAAIIALAQTVEVYKAAAEAVKEKAKPFKGKLDTLQDGVDSCIVDMGHNLETLGQNIDPRMKLAAGRTQKVKTMKLDLAAIEAMKFKL